MPVLLSRKQFNSWPLLLLLLATNAVLIANTPSSLRYVAALVLLAFLPGWTWLQLLFKPPSDPAERLTLAIGLSLALAIVGAMGAVYLPGPLTANHLLMTTNAIIVTGLVAGWWRAGSQVHVTAPSPHHSPVSARVWLILAALLILAAALRLPRLGYAEFHEDEAEALMLGVRLFQGEDYALFLHRKGPAQMLVPVAFWLLTGRISESMARFPFALSSLLSVAPLFFMGRRWFHWPAGAIAGLLWAANGYAIGFGRMVQYQALIFFLGPLALYCLYLAWKDRRPTLQIVAAVLLAACLLAHFDALLLLPAAGYLGWIGLTKSARPPDSNEAGAQAPRRFPFIAGGVALTLFLALLASFYIPYILDPEFQNTAGYLSQSRIKPGLLYNNLKLLQRLDKTYSSHFYLPLLAVGLAGLAGWQSARLSKKWRWGLVGLGLLLAATVWRPEMWQAGPASLALLPWLVFGFLCVWLAPTIELKAGWIMLGAGFIGYVFLVDDPRTHLYILYPGAVLLAGARLALPPATASVGGPIEPGERLVPQPASLRANLPRVILLAAGMLLSAGIIIYEAAIFLPTESTFSRLQQRWAGSMWETIYDDLPEARSYFGYPKREGWKAIGALRAQGLFPGDFRSVNEDFIIPIWYNFGQARSCYNTPAHFFVRAASGEQPPTDKPYIEVGQVEREGEIRLRIFSAQTGEPPSKPAVYTLEALAATFDQLATPRQFARQAQPAHQMETQFGPAIKFTGYDLPVAVFAPGDILHLTLYWQALKNPGADYRAFVHLTDGSTLWGQQDDDPACRLPTSIWRAGQRGVGQFRLAIDPQTPPGRYPLIIGLYRAGSLERLPITAGAGQPGDDFLWLQDIQVVEADRRAN